MGIRCLLRSLISAIMIGFLFLLTISPKESSALDVQIDTEKRTWRNANFWCQLLGSNESGLFFELSDTFTNHVPEDGREYWIAAIKKTTAPFKFDRCISITNERKTYLHKTNQPVYDCYNFCNGSRFALSSRQCVCIDFLQTKVTISRCYNTLFNNTQMDFYSEKAFLELQTGQFRSQANGTGDCAAVILIPGKSVGLHEFLPCSTKLPCVYIYFDNALTSNSQ
ncbi:uncharacterized protein LOC133176467 [Saccostrea echinata]|uniref:uncharacterized protein LOC133176467 n=1 Tax=Saccostrea echinata TaxID=191078 RepID=UPI002A822BDB|nr:uncharacterized protein LOC133176467 [Saccostrea echinata]